VVPSAPPPKQTPPPPPQKEKKKSDAAAPPAEEAVGRRLRVYWPLDKAWYEGRVDAYDAGSGRHRVVYDDGEEEEVDLGKEKFEWAAQEAATPQPARKLRRLRRMSDTAEAKSPAVTEEDEDAGDSTEDEDWKKDAAQEEESEEVDLDDEEEEEEVLTVSSSKGKKRNSLSTSASGSTLPSTSRLGSASASSGSTLSTKRKNVDVGTLGCAKKFSFQLDNNTPEKAELKVPMSFDRSE
jgi:DNA mismatch repair protein MSH6